MGDENKPFKEEFFDLVVRRALNMDADCKPPGLYRLETIFREPQIDNVFIRDEQAIEESEEFSYTMPCPVAHPGLCAEEDAEFLPFIRAATNILRSVIVRWPPTSVGMLWTSGEGVAHSEKFFSKSHFRHAGPKVALLTKCDMFADGSVELRSGDDGFVDCVDLSLVGEFFQETRSVDFRLYVGRLNLDDAFFCTNGAKRRIRLVEGDGFDIVPTMLHPVQKPVTAKRSSEFGAGLKKMDAALHSCEQRTHIGGVKLC